MTTLGNKFGIVCQLPFNKISFFDSETLNLLYELNLSASPYDVAITPDNSKAVVAAMNRLFLIDLVNYPPSVIDSQVLDLPADDVEITPDGRFAVIVDSRNTASMISYDINNKSIISSINGDAQAVAVSPIGNGLILATDAYNNLVRIFNINSSGTLIATGNTISSSLSPINVTFSPNGNFAFIVNSDASTVTVLDTSNQNAITVLNNVSCCSKPQSVITSADGSKVFVLGESNVDIFNFSTASPYLTLSLRFNHLLLINSFFGVDQIALSSDEDKIFISGSNETLKGFDLAGNLIGTVNGVVSHGGIAITKKQPITTITVKPGMAPINVTQVSANSKGSSKVKFLVQLPVVEVSTTVLITLCIKIQIGSTIVNVYYSKVVIIYPGINAQQEFEVLLPNGSTILDATAFFDEIYL